MRKVSLFIFILLTLITHLHSGGQSIDSSFKRRVGISYYSLFPVRPIFDRSFHEFQVRVEAPIYKKITGRMCLLFRTETHRNPYIKYNPFTGVAFSLNYNTKLKRHPRFGFKFSLEYEYLHYNDITEQIFPVNSKYDSYSMGNFWGIGPAIGTTYSINKRWEVMIDLTCVAGNAWNQFYATPYRIRFRELESFSLNLTQFFGANINYKF